MSDEQSRKAFMEQVFLAVLPTLVNQTGFDDNGERLNTVRRKVKFAWEFAIEAAKQQETKS